MYNEYVIKFNEVKSEYDKLFLLYNETLKEILVLQATKCSSKDSLKRIVHPKNNYFYFQDEYDFLTLICTNNKIVAIDSEILLKVYRSKLMSTYCKILNEILLDTSEYISYLEKLNLSDLIFLSNCIDEISYLQKDTLFKEKFEKLFKQEISLAQFKEFCNDFIKKLNNLKEKLKYEIALKN